MGQQRGSRILKAMELGCWSLSPLMLALVSSGGPQGALKGCSVPLECDLGMPHSANVCINLSQRRLVLEKAQGWAISASAHVSLTLPHAIPSSGPLGQYLLSLLLNYAICKVQVIFSSSFMCQALSQVA